MMLRFRRALRLLALLVMLALLVGLPTPSPVSAAKTKVWTVTIAGDTKPADKGVVGTKPQTGDLRYVLSHITAAGANIQFDTTKLVPDPTNGTVRITLTAPLALPANTVNLTLDGLSQTTKAVKCAKDSPAPTVTIDGGGVASGFTISKAAKVRFLSFVNFTGAAISVGDISFIECAQFGTAADGTSGPNGIGAQAVGKNVVITYSSFTGNTGAGLALTNTTKASVSFNTAIGNGGAGIALSGAKVGSILNNTVGGNGDSGIKVDGGASSNVIGFNEFTGNTPAGVMLGDPTTGAALHTVIGISSLSKRGRPNTFYDNGLSPSAATLAKIERTYHVRLSRARVAAKPADTTAIGGGVVIINGNQNTVRGNNTPCGTNCGVAGGNRGLDIDLAPTAGYNASGASGVPNSSPPRPTITKAKCVLSASKTSSTCTFTGKSAPGVKVDFYVNGFYVLGIATKSGDFTTNAKIKSTADFTAPQKGDTIEGVITLVKGAATGSTGEPSDPFTITDN